LEALHHPFTAPRSDDVADGGDLQAARAQAYDLVLNGTEIGGELAPAFPMACGPDVACMEPRTPSLWRLHEVQTLLPLSACTGIFEARVAHGTGAVMIPYC